MQSKETGHNYLEVHDIYSSPRVREFLGTVQEGDNIAFIDNDQTITKKGIDSEDLALAAGIWPPEKRVQSGSESLPSQAIDTQAVGAPALEALRQTLQNYTPYVTEELSTITGIPEGTAMNCDVLKKVGNHVGRKIIKENLLRENAMDVLGALMANNIRPIILTATPVDIVEGVYQELNNKYKFASPVTIIGTEIAFDPKGQPSVALHLFGPPKLKIVNACKEKGGIALFGVGDKPATSDEFIWQCENPVPINDKEYGEFGERQWKALAAVARNSV